VDVDLRKCRTCELWSCVTRMLIGVNSKRGRDSTVLTCSKDDAPRK